MRYLKKYVGVYTYTDEKGVSSPVSLVWEDGRSFRINAVKSVKNAPPDHVGGLVTVRYDVVVEGFSRVLYYETYLNKWFVEKLCENYN
ncbi:MAG: hypothetical protein J6Z34_05740 [Clostridia bacterium]|nr:hypothetical protein [Clostridia bacterium]